MGVGVVDRLKEGHMLAGFASQQETTEAALACACVTLDFFFVELKLVLKLSMNCSGRICTYT